MSEKLEVSGENIEKRLRKQKNRKTQNLKVKSGEWLLEKTVVE